MSDEPLPGGWSFGRIIIALIIGAAMIGVLYVVLGVFGIVIPAFVVMIFWIVVAAMIGVLAIKLLMRWM